jgi:hypothetical protein
MDIHPSQAIASRTRAPVICPDVWCALVVPCLLVLPHTSCKHPTYMKAPILVSGLATALSTLTI